MFAWNPVTEKTGISKYLWQMHLAISLYSAICLRQMITFKQMGDRQMDFYDIWIMEYILLCGIANGGVVRPVDIERYCRDADVDHSSYKIRKVFKAMARAGMLRFNHNHYLITADNRMNVITSDAAQVAEMELA
jgi:hypothetical protein